MVTDEPFRVVFVCLGNRVRSVMAKAILDNCLRELNIESIKTDSAGMIRLSGAKAAENTIKICAEHDLDVHAHRSQQLDGSHIFGVNLIITMEAEQREYLKAVYADYGGKIYTLTGFKGESDSDIHDPFVEGKEAYEKVFAEIEFHIKRILPLILSDAKVGESA